MSDSTESEGTEGEGTEGSGTEAAGQGEVTAEELQGITSEEQITDRTHESFKPDYDKAPDDTSYAEGGDA
jgi:hypothetical protein